MSSGDDFNERFIKSILEDVLSKVDQAELIDLQLYKENVDEVIADINAEPYTRIPLDEMKLPHNGKVKLNLTIRQKNSKREINIIASTTTHNGNLRYTEKVESPMFDTLPQEADQNKKVKSEAVNQVVVFGTKFIQLIISLLNTIINSGLLKSS